MTAWFIAAAAVLIVELFVGTVYLLVVSAALFGAGLVYWLTGDTSIAVAAAGRFFAPRERARSARRCDARG